MKESHRLFFPLPGSKTEKLISVPASNSDFLASKGLIFFAEFGQPHLSLLHPFAMQVRKRSMSCLLPES